MNKLNPGKYFKDPKISLFFDKILKPLQMVVDVFNPAGCIGDFVLKDLLNNKDAKKANCNYFPLSEKDKMSALSFAVRNVPCGTPVAVNFCSVFDKGGNWGISISGGALSCFTAATGFGAFLAPIAGAVSYLQLGYSPDRKWTTKMTFLNANDKKPKDKEFKLKSHFYMGGGIALPEFPIKIGTFDFNDILSGSIIGTLNVDYGINNPFSIDNMKNLFTETNIDNALEKIRSVILPARETSFSVTANLKINLEKITNGFLKEMNFNGAEIMMMVSIPGVKGEHGSTGLPGGIYITFTPSPRLITDFVQPFIHKITKHFEHFDFNPKFPKLDKVIVSFYLGKSFQLQMKFGRVLSLICVFHFTEFTASCRKSGKVLEFLKDKGKLIAKKIKDFKE
jgi:hypothetical protein